MNFKIRLQQIRKDSLPATDAILRQCLDAELVQELAAAEPQRIYAGHTPSYDWMTCPEGMRLIDLRDIFKQGYRIHGAKGMLLRRHEVRT